MMGDRGLDMDASSGPPLLRDPLLYGVALIAIAALSPFFRYVQLLTDEGVVLHGAVRILDGEVLYRDFFEFLGPGSFLIAATWMKLVGVGFASVRVLAVGVIAAIAALLYAAARVSSGNRPLAALLAIAWPIFLPGTGAVISHHWFTTAASMASAVGLLHALDHAPRRGAAFAAGLFAGTAAMVTQTRGALLCFAVCVVLLSLRGARTRLVSAIAGMAIFPTAMILELAAMGALGAAFNDAVWFPAGHYAGIQGVPFGSFADSWADTASVAFFPVTFVLAGATIASTRGTIWREPRLRAALALAIVGVLGAYPRPDISHINYTVPLVCPLFALVATNLLGRLEPRRARTAVGAIAIGLCLAWVGYTFMMTMFSVTTRLQAMPTARGPIVRTQDLRTNNLAALLAQIDSVPPDDGFFFYPYSPLLPYLTGRRHVAAFDVMTPGYTTAEQFRETCVRVVNEAHWAVIDRMWTDPRGLRIIFPAMRDPDPREKREFEWAIARAFDKIVHTSVYFELRQRATNASVALCDKVG